MRLLAVALAALGLVPIVGAPATADDNYRFGFGRFAAQANHDRHHDDLDHRAFHRELDHREAHRYPMTWRQHDRLHDALDHDAFHDELEHRAAHRSGAYYPRRGYGYGSGIQWIPGRGIGYSSGGFSIWFCR